MICRLLLNFQNSSHFCSCLILTSSHNSNFGSDILEMATRSVSLKLIISHSFSHSFSTLYLQFRFCLRSRKYHIFLCLIIIPFRYSISLRIVSMYKLIIFVYNPSLQNFFSLIALSIFGPPN